jgi:hypothetical protein
MMRSVKIMSELATQGLQQRITEYYPEQCQRKICKNISDKACGWAGRVAAGTATVDDTLREAQADAENHRGCPGSAEDTGDGLPGTACGSFRT